VSDIFNEVDEEVRREQLKKLWDRYSVYIVAGAVIIVLMVAGWRSYEWWQAKKAAEAGATFQSAMALSTEGKHAEAEAAFAKIADDGARGYRDLARLREAAELAQRDPKAAVAAYDAITSDAAMPQTLQDLAALRAGYILVDSGAYEDVRRRVEPLTAPDRTFRNTARELLGLSAWRAGDLAAARNWFDMILNDPGATAGTRRRVEMLMTLSAATGKG
jgi:hypothetical protein